MEHIHTTRDACTTTPRVTPTVQTPTVQTPTSTDGTNTDGTRPQVEVCSATRVQLYRVRYARSAHSSTRTRYDRRMCPEHCPVHGRGRASVIE